MSDLAKVFAKIPERINPSAAQSMSCIFQFVIDGDQTYFIAVDRGEVEVEQAQHANPTVTLLCDSETFFGVIDGSIKGMAAYMSGKLKAQGNIMSALKLSDLFAS